MKKTLLVFSLIIAMLLLFTAEVLAQGSLTYTGKSVRANGLYGPQNIVLTRDGTRAIMCCNDNGVSVYSRDTGTGALTQMSTFMKFDKGYYAGGTTNVLGNPYFMALSPDENHLYVACYSDTAVAVLGFNKTAGTLSLLSFNKKFTYAGADSALLSPYGIAVSPDGKNVYVAVYGKSALAVFNRNATTGALTAYESFIDNKDGVDCLGGAQGITVAPDGKNVYVSSYTESAVAQFKRDLTTGHLTFLSASLTTKDVSPWLMGLQGPRMIVVTPERGGIQFVLVEAYTGNDISVLMRDNSADGALSFLSYSGKNYSDGGFNVMRAPYRMALSADSNQVYITPTSSNNIVVFSIDYGTGDLTFAQAVRDSGTTEDRGLSGPYGVAPSPDGKNVYVCGTTEDYICVLDRNATTGMLTYMPAKNVTGYYCGDIRINVLPSNKQNLYLTSYSSTAAYGGVYAFNRNTTTGELTYLNKYVGSTVLTDPTYRSALYATDIVISPDDKYLYTTTQSYKRISVYERNLTTGALTFVQTDSGLSTYYMSSPLTIIMSPDGKHIYVGDAGNQTLSLWNRSSTDGRVTYVAKYPDSVLINQNLKSPYWGTITSDGAYLYVPAYGSHAVTVFSRNATTGALTLVQSLVDSANIAYNSLRSPAWARLSSDNNFLYVTAYASKAINVFLRSTSDGTLTLVQTLKDTINLNGVQPMALNSTGTKLFAGAQVNRSLAEFNRNVTTGQLTFVRSYLNLVDVPINGIYYPYGITITSEGHLYLTNRSTGSLLLFTIGATGISNTVNNPFDYHLYQNYPNPFNPVTTIKFTVPKAVEVTMKVYNALGQEVATILDNKLCSKGENVAIWNAGNFGSGVYFYVIKAGEYKAVKKMMLIK